MIRVFGRRRKTPSFFSRLAGCGMIAQGFKEPATDLVAQKAINAAAVNRAFGRKVGAIRGRARVAGSWKASFRVRAFIGTLNLDLQTNCRWSPSPFPRGEGRGERFVCIFGLTS